MDTELTIAIVIAIIALAFVCEYIDSTLGMGYGTTLTPVLLCMGFAPLQIIPAVLLSELFTGLLAGFTHHAMGNVVLLPRTMRVTLIARRFREAGFVNGIREGLPLHLQVTLVIASCSIIGTVASVLLALNLSKFFLKLYIGLLVFAIGIVILATLNRTFVFSWKRIVGLGLLASFNKGISGGGYGPVVTGGQLLAGVDGKNAIGITSLAEGLTCIVGVAMYWFYPQEIDWCLAPWLCLGALLSVPLSAWTVKVIRTDKLRLAIGVITLLLGATTLWQTLAQAATSKTVEPSITPQHTEAQQTQPAEAPQPAEASTETISSQELLAQSQPEPKGTAMQLEKNSLAPLFSLPDHQGKIVNLQDFLGGKVLVYFYPKADTPGCTTQACALRDAWADLQQAGVTVLGISPDKVAAQKKFADKFGLNFALLADEDHSVAEAYGVWAEKSMYGRKYFGILRSSFLIGPDGKIIEAWYKISPKDTAPKALQAATDADR